MLHYRGLDDATRADLEGVAQVLLAEKRFEGCGGLEMNDEVRVTIAVQAAVLLLGRESRCFGRLRSILVYPTEFVVHDVEELEDGTVYEGPDTRLGESWGDADSVVLAWDEALAGARHRAGRENVILHEFAHQLDHETGTDDGTPTLPDRDLAAAWARVMQAEFAALRDADARGAATLIDPYGAESPAEFFAVAVEAFFMDSHRLARRHESLHALLRRYFTVDPRDWRTA